MSMDDRDLAHMLCATIHERTPDNGTVSKGPER
jgi:hypothetical protein